MAKTEVMVKADLIKEVARRLDYTQKDVKAVLEATQTVVYEEMAKEHEVKLFDGCTLAGSLREARECRNPQTGATMEVPAKLVPKAKWGKAAKDALNA